MTMLDPKAMDTAREAWIASDVATRFFSDVEEHALQAAITAYLSTITPAEVGGLVDAQTEAREIEAQAWCCDEWPEWLHKIVDETCEVADRLDMSAEQAHAYAVLAALAANDAELAAVKANCETVCNSYADENQRLYDRAERAEAALAEVRKALSRLTAWLSDEYDDVPNIASVSFVFDNGEEIAALPLGDFRAARRALTGGNNG